MEFGKSILVTGNGARIVIKHPRRNSDEVIDDLLSHMQRGENWSVVNHELTTAFIKDQQLYIINMNNIVGVGS